MARKKTLKWETMIHGSELNGTRRNHVHFEAIIDGNNIQISIDGHPLLMVAYQNIYLYDSIAERYGFTVLPTNILLMSEGLQP